MDSTTSERLLTVKDVAAMFSVRPSWVYTQVANNGIPCVHVGRYVRFVRSDLLAWLQKNNRPA